MRAFVRWIRERAPSTASRVNASGAYRRSFPWACQCPHRWTRPVPHPGRPPPGCAGRLWPPWQPEFPPRSTGYLISRTEAGTTGASESAWTDRLSSGRVRQHDCTAAGRRVERRIGGLPRLAGGAAWLVVGRRHGIVPHAKLDQHRPLRERAEQDEELRDDVGGEELAAVVLDAKDDEPVILVRRVLGAVEVVESPRELWDPAGSRGAGLQGRGVEGRRGVRV